MLNDLPTLIACSGPGAAHAIWMNTLIGYCAAVAGAVMTGAILYDRHRRQTRAMPSTTALIAFLIHPAWTVSATHGDCGSMKFILSLIFSGGFVVLMCVQHFLRSYVNHPGLCRKCGYDLRGTPSGVCPECGTHHEKPPTTPAPPPHAQPLPPASAPADSTMYCSKCRYSLQGLTSHSCPECGQPFNPLDPSSYLPTPTYVSPAARKLATGVYLFAALWLFAMPCMGVGADHRQFPMPVGLLLTLVSFGCVAAMFYVPFLYHRQPMSAASFALLSVLLSFFLLCGVGVLWFWNA